MFFCYLIVVRTSQFIIGLNKYLEALNYGLSVGMRFKMKFEGEDSPERRFTGTIVGVGDVSPQWSDSKWRSLKVDEKHFCFMDSIFNMFMFCFLLLMC